LLESESSTDGSGAPFPKESSIAGNFAKLGDPMCGSLSPGNAFAGTL
jgi:hypothetical protein